jgi:hypothetical protein
MVGRMIELRFERGQASVREVQEVVDQVLAELRDPDSESAKLAREAGLDPEQLASAQVTVSEEGAKVDPVTATILITIAAPITVHIATKFWDDVIWKRLVPPHGGKAVGKKKKKKRKQ